MTNTTGKRLLLILSLISTMALIIRDLHARRHGEASYEAAQAIAGGYHGEQALNSVYQKPIRAFSTDPNVLDDQIRARELEAGAAWAKIYHAKKVFDCPMKSRGFYAGCVGAMRGEWPDQPD